MYDYTEEGKSHAPYIISLGLCVCIAAGLGGWALYEGGKPKIIPDATTGCYRDKKAARHDIALLDVTSEWIDVHRKDLHAFLSSLWDNDMEFGDKLSIFTMDEKFTASIPVPRVSVCKPPATEKDLQSIGDNEAAAEEYLEGQNKHLYRSRIGRVIDGFFDDSVSSSMPASPLFQMIQGISEHSLFAEEGVGKHMIIQSDMLQNYHDINFCWRKGHLPSFNNFAKSKKYKVIKPNDMTGVKVTLLVRPYDYSTAPYCKNTEEVIRFWEGFFLYNGVAREDLKIKRLLDIAGK